MSLVDCFHKRPVFQVFFIVKPIYKSVKEVYQLNKKSMKVEL
jgi:hypothetical protein